MAGYEIIKQGNIAMEGLVECQVCHAVFRYPVSARHRYTRYGGDVVDCPTPGCQEQVPAIAPTAATP